MRTFLVLTLLTLIVVFAGCATTGGTSTGSREPGGYSTKPSGYPGGSSGY